MDRKGENPANITPALLRAHEALGQLTDTDLAESDTGTLIAFMVRCESWAYAARKQISEPRQSG